MMKSKIHRATITDSDLNYVGSITIDELLLQQADILASEQVTVVDVTNGARFETYTIPGERGSGEIKVNGAAARLVHRGDLVIVISYGSYDETELSRYGPRVVHVDKENRTVAVDSLIGTQAGETKQLALDELLSPPGIPIRDGRRRAHV